MVMWDQIWTDLNFATFKSIQPFSIWVHQLSEKASDLAEENTVLRGKNTDKRRKINMLEDEQQRLVKRNAYRLKVGTLKN